VIIALLLTLSPLALGPQRTAAIATEEAIGRTFAVFDVHDILTRDAPRVRLTDADALSEEDARATRESRALVDLIEIVGDLLEPALVPELEHVRVAGTTSLVVLGRERQHRWVRRFLELQRTSDERLIDLQAVFVQGPRGSFRKLGFESSSAVLETPAELDDLLQRIAHDPKLERVTSPRVTTFNRQRATVSVTNEVNYVKEYRLRIQQPGAAEIADPVIDTVREGCTIELRGVRVEDELYALDITLQQSEVSRPMRTRKVRVSAVSDAEVEVCTPEVATISVESRVLLADGASVVFLTASPVRDRDLAVVLSLRTVPRAALEPDGPSSLIDAGRKGD